eukprot:Seg2926.2 transcript_id=Seg2926.2/GoldUCD/mRNA.D3Y31 product=Cubilin protein_id=Seg2926.2/GoldUCD/D3Y31
MYSPDGYAKIKFHSDGSQSGKGFKLTYRLRNIDSDYLGYRYSDCSTENMYSSSNIFYTSKWPKEYQDDGTCKYQISKEGTKKLIFMDLDLRSISRFYCNSYSDDRIEIRGAKKYGESFSDATSLKGPFCGTSSIVTYTSSYRYLLVQLKRNRDLKLSHSSKRGFVAGYVTYTTGSSSPNKFPVGAVVGVTVTFLILIIGGIIACIVCRKKSRTPPQRQPIATSQGQAPVTYGYPASTAYPATTAYPTMHTAYPGAPAQAGYQVPSPYAYSKPGNQAGYEGAAPYPMEAPPPYSAAYDAPTANQGEATVGIPTAGIPTTGIPTTGMPTTEIPTTAVTTTAQPSYNPTYVQPYPGAADCHCIRTYYASSHERRRTISLKGYSNDQYCSFTIQPRYRYSPNAGIFLEITWIDFFDVKGTMPDCENDYVEVFLTRSHKSIGRFCSNNLVQQNKILFDMYSYDGYAKIVFHSDSLHTGNGFAVSYKLRTIRDDYIGVNDCSTNTMLSSTNFYSTKWPREYKDGPSCDWRISEEGTKKIIFMDLDLRYESKATFCNKSSDDHIEIRGARARTSFEEATHLKGPICGTSSIVMYTTSYQWVALQLTRQTSQAPRPTSWRYDWSSEPSERGFIAGYVTYTTGAEKSFSKRTSPVVMSIGVGVIVGILILVILGCCIACHIRNKRRRRSHVQRTSMSAASPTATTTYQLDAPPQAPPCYADCAREVLLPTASDDLPPPYDSLPPPYNDVL